MSKTTDNAENQDDPRWMFDMDNNVIEVSSSSGMIRIFAWKVTEDSLGRPYQDDAGTLELSPRKAIELARRLLNAATVSKDDHL
ncbi:MAG: hypothetical protein K8R24_08735 [Mycobacterium sp.]|nr:hypothetical protein [Mycobacterium sp.]